MEHQQPLDVASDLSRIVAFDVLGGRRQALDELGAIELDAAVARFGQPAAELSELIDKFTGAIGRTLAAG